MGCRRWRASEDRLFGLTRPLVVRASRGLQTTAKREATPGSSTRSDGSATRHGAMFPSSGHEISPITGQGLHRRETRRRRLSVEKIEHKIRQGRPERPHHAQGMFGCRKRTASGRHCSRHREGAQDHALRRGVGWRLDPRWVPTRLHSVGPGAPAVRQAMARIGAGYPRQEIANITASQCLLVRQAQLYAEGKMTTPMRRSPKASGKAKSRETLRGPAVALAARHRRRLQGRTLLHRAEALYSLRGTYQMQNLMSAKPSPGSAPSSSKISTQQLFLQGSHEPTVNASPSSARRYRRSWADSSGKGPQSRSDRPAPGREALRITWRPPGLRSAMG